MEYDLTHSRSYLLKLGVRGKNESICILSIFFVYYLSIEDYLSIKHVLMYGLGSGSLLVNFDGHSDYLHKQISANTPPPSNSMAFLVDHASTLWANSALHSNFKSNPPSFIWVAMKTVRLAKSYYRYPLGFSNPHTGALKGLSLSLVPHIASRTIIIIYAI